MKKPTVITQPVSTLNTPQPFTQWKQMTCPSCLDEYTLGKTGTISGCDRCEGITRDRNGMIIPDPFVENFIVVVEPGDTQS